MSKVNSGDVDCHSLILTRCDTPDLKGLTSWVHSAWWCHALHCIWLVDCYILRFLFFFFFLSFPFDLHHWNPFMLQFCCIQILNSRTWILLLCFIMADSDRSRSPMPGRNRSEPRGPAQPMRQDLPFLPRWCGPMQAAILHSQNMPRPQFRPQWATSQSGPYMMGRTMNPNASMTQGTWSGHRFPPAPPSSPPPTLPYPAPSRPATPPCSPTCHALQHRHALRALHRSLHPSLVHSRLPSRPPQEVRNIMMLPAPMGSTSILIGKGIKTTTTIKRSTVWPSHAAFANQLSHKSWT